MAQVATRTPTLWLAPLQRWLNDRRFQAGVRRLKVQPGSNPGGLTWEEVRLLRGYDRLTRSESGVATLKYTAIDPADRYVRCNCGKPDCWTTQLLPLREHMAALFRAINACGYAEQFEAYERCDYAWPGVTDALQMAASIDDVFTDPAYVDDSEAWLYCESVADFDAREREYAAKYVAAFITFNFVWNAYEAATEISAANAFLRDKTSVRARRLFAAETELSHAISTLETSYRLARHFCAKAPELVVDIDAIKAKYNLEGAAAAAELCRLFRNYVVHGRDDLPTSESHLACWRFYSVIRLVLLLIQLLVFRRLVDRDAVVPLSVHGEGEATRAGIYLVNLHRHKELWFTEGEHWFERDGELGGN